jgi:glucose/arabinose dehydrogenase/cytochrome c553
MRKFGLAVSLVFIVGIGACCLLMPEGFAIRGPIFNSMLGRGIDPPSETVVQGRFRVPEGYRIELFAEGIENARFMRFSPGGDLIISQPRIGRLLHVARDADGDGRSDGQQPLLEGLDRPHGFDFRDGQLYIGEGSAIARVAFSEDGPDSIRVTGDTTRIAEGIPEGGNHWSRTLRFGPDGMIYLQVGSSCNVCEEEDPRRAAILRFSADGSGEEIYAAGLRNSVGFDWRPGTNELYATDNGRDLIGDDYPPCELNRIEQGGFYGWPYANGDNRPDPDFGEDNASRIAASIPPVHSFNAHNAPLGITFLRHPSAPPTLRGAALVALHGSWNRSRLDGYKVVSLHWDAEGRITERDFLTGFEVDEDVIGRPVDVAEGPDGAIYVSDDYANVIYRVSRGHGVDDSLAVPRAAPRVMNDPLDELDSEARAELAAAGASLYAQHACGTCHSADQAAPGVVVKPLAGLASRYTIDSLTRFFLTPTPPMPAFALSEQERRALAVHVLEEYR